MRLLQRVLNPNALTAFSQPPIWLQPDTSYWSSVIGEKERIGNDFKGYVRDAYKANGVIFACILARLLVFSEARFAWQELDDAGRPGDLFTNTDLDLLERPWPNATTGHLLARMEQDASLAGNFYGTIRGEDKKARIRRMNPDHVTIVTGSPDDDPFHIDAQLVAYIYNPRGTGICNHWH
jgi:phage portal protein BeeE